jgi:RNA polymerase sigma-70 factor (ECF subfamily)
VINRLSRDHGLLVGGVGATVEPIPASPVSGGDAMADSARLRAMIDQHFDFIWRQLRRLGLPADVADDAAQQVLIVASRKLHEIAEGRERSFLLGTAIRVASDMRRATARRHEVDGDDASEPADPAPRADELLDRHRARVVLDEVLAKMDLELRTVFMLFELEEMTMAEIAELLEVPPGTVASRLRRAREQFELALKRRNTGGDSR